MVDLDLPHRVDQPPSEPRYAVSKEWERVICLPFLDNEKSAKLSRALYLPAKAWQKHNSFGDYCLLRHRGLLP